MNAPHLLWKIPEAFSIPEVIHRLILLADWEGLRAELETLRAENQSLYAETMQKLDYLLRDEIRFQWDFRYAAGHYFYIVDRDRKEVLFDFNDAQNAIFERILDEFPVRQYVLKSRKFGCSTFFLLLYYWDCLTSKNSTSVIIAHEYEPSERLFKIVTFANNHLPDKFKPKMRFDNRREILFDKNNSYFFVGSAQKQDFGRSDTINNLLMSEFAFWPNPESSLASLSEASSEETGNMVVETTPSPKPFFKQFHNECKRGSVEFEREDGEGGERRRRDAISASGERRRRDAISASVEYKKAAFDYLFFPWFFAKNYQMEIIDDAEIAYLDGQLTDEERLMMGQHELSWEQMKFWLSKRARLKSSVWQEYPPDDLSCFLSTGERDFFDTRMLHKIYLLVQNVVPLELRDNGQVIIYKRPAFGRIYLIAADTSKGLLTGSKAAAVVIDAESAEEVAELHGIYSPHELGIALAKLGEFYSWALIAVEENNHGHSTLNTLKNQLYYPNLYYHIDSNYEDWLRKKSGIGSSKRPIQEGNLGWPTNSKTKPIMFADLREEVINELAMIIKSQKFIEECMGVKEKDGEIYSDELYDTVVARAIAWQVRKRMKFGISTMVHHVRKTTERKGSGETSFPWVDERRVGESASRRVGESASRRVGESASGRVGEWASGRVGELARPDAQKDASDAAGERANASVGRSQPATSALERYRAILADESLSDSEIADLNVSSQAIAGVKLPEKASRSVGRVKKRNVAAKGPWEL